MNTDVLAVERRPSKPWVAGSSPAEGVTKSLQTGTFETFAADTRSVPESVSASPYVATNETTEGPTLPRGIRQRLTRAGEIRYRATAYVNGRQVMGPWVRELDEAVGQREAMLAAKGASRRREWGAPRADPRPTIYFIQAGSNGPIKIGFTLGDPGGRLVTLQTGHYEELRLLGSMPGLQAVEQLIHEELAAHHIRGEWFRPDPEVLAVVDECRTQPGLAGPRSKGDESDEDPPSSSPVRERRRDRRAHSQATEQPAMSVRLRQPRSVRAA